MFTIKPRTRIQEGASWEDIQDGDRSEKKYSCGRRDDISYERMLKKDTPVFVDFTY